MNKIVTYDLNAIRGDSFSVSIRFSTDGTVDDMSAYVWSAQIRKSEDAEEFVAFDIDDASADQGIIALHLEAEPMADVRSGVWDLQGVLDGNVRTFVRGKFTVLKDVTR